MDATPLTPTQKNAINKLMWSAGCEWSARVTPTESAALLELLPDITANVHPQQTTLDHQAGN